MATDGVIKMERLPISKITVDSKIQSREYINKEVVAEYAEGIKNGDSFPPVVVFFDGIDYWLADGFHRIYAYKLSEVTEIDCDVREGGYRDAILHSVGANGKHGLRRTNADKRKAALMLLEDEEWARWSAYKIAELCGVSHTFIDNLRPSLATVASDKVYTDKYGNISTMNTANIGKSKHAEPPIEPEPEEEKHYSLHCIADDPQYMNYKNEVITPECEIYTGEEQTPADIGYMQFLKVMKQLEGILTVENTKSFSVIDKAFLKQQLIQIQNRIGDIIYAIERDE